MSLINRRRKLPSINIIPLVDVLTVLLFFFLVTMQFKQISALNITVPEIKTAGKNQIEEQVVIAISPAGKFYLNDHEVSEARLEKAIKLAGQNTPEIPIFLIADEETSLRHVTTVIDICRSNRLNKIRLQSR